MGLLPNPSNRYNWGMWGHGHTTLVTPPPPRPPPALVDMELINYVAPPPPPPQGGACCHEGGGGLQHTPTLIFWHILSLDGRPWFTLRSLAIFCAGPSHPGQKKGWKPPGKGTSLWKIIQTWPERGPAPALGAGLEYCGFVFTLHSHAPAHGRRGAHFKPIKQATPPGGGGGPSPHPQERACFKERQPGLECLRRARSS